MENFLKEYKGITLNVNDDNTMSFISDFLFQALENKVDYEYNGDILNITEIKRLPNDKCLNITFEKKMSAAVKEIIDKPKRKYTSRKNIFNDVTIIIDGSMKPAVMTKYNLKAGDIYDSIEQLMEHCGLSKEVFYSWLNKKWIRTEPRPVKLSSQYNRGYISEADRKSIMGDSKARLL